MSCLNCLNCSNKQRDFLNKSLESWRDRYTKGEVPIALTIGPETKWLGLKRVSRMNSFQRHVQDTGTAGVDIRAQEVAACPLKTGVLAVLGVGQCCHP